jgi:clan AA aspartic protease
MGVTFVELTVAHLNDPQRSVTEQFLVDSGATHTVLPERIWKTLGLEPVDTVRVRLADGRVTTRPVGFAMVRFDGHMAPTRVLLGEPDDSLLLGVVTLEEMGLMLDPLKRTLSAMEIRM